MPVSLRLSVLPLAAFLLLLGAPPAGAALSPFASTPGAASTNVNGADEDDFRADLVAYNQPGSESSWRNDYSRAVGWEDETLPAISLDAFASPALLPAGYYNQTVKQGLVVETPGSGITVSQDDNAGGDADPDLVNFKDVLPAYNFAGYNQRRMSPVGSRVVDFRFFRPGTDVPATVKAFGVVISGVDLPGSTFEVFDEQGASLDLRTVPTKTASGLSFMGLRGTTERIARVRVQLGTDVLGTAEDGAHDVAVLDDVLYPEPWQVLPGLGLAAPAFTAAESQGGAAITFRRSGDAASAASVTFTTVDGSARAGEDYTATTGSVAFGAGETTKVATIPVANDGRTEGDETFSVRVTGAQGGATVAPTSATVTIADAVVGAGGGGGTTTTTTTTTTTPPPDTTKPAVTLTGLAAKQKLSQVRSKGLSFKVAVDEPVTLDAAVRATTRKATIAAYDLALAERRLPRAGGTRTVTLKPTPRYLRKGAKLRVSVIATDGAANQTTVTRVIRLT